MPKMTLLQMTQNILSAMNSDTVDTINATAESLQVAQHIEDSYFKMMSEKNWAHLQTLDQLTSVGDPATPTKMQLPALTTDINWIKYDCRTTSTSPPLVRDINYLTPYDFLSMVSNRDSARTNVISTIDVASGVSLNVLNDRAPTNWTSFDDEFIYMDAYNVSLETTLQQGKSSIYVIKEPIWTATDAFIPDLPSHMFPALLSQAKSVCFNYVKQTPSSMEERDSKRQRVSLQEKGRREQLGNKRTINYGRR